VFGGERVVRRYETRPSVLVQGPGRSKILFTSGVDWRPHLEMVVDSISHEGGTACVNTTAVFVEGDPSPVAEAIAGRLSELPSLPPEDERAVLPVLTLDRARQIEGRLLRRAAGTLAWLGGDGIVDDLGDGSAVLRPAVHQLDRPDAGQARVELPFPSVWVAPWNAGAGVEPLRDSLVLSALTDDERLLDRLLAEPTIANLYVGSHVTYKSEQGLPHDGYLADFLMRTKTVLR
jgi:acyl-CoA reductase-like NAD-dependent aldehyde dehydrogenase